MAIILPSITFTEIPGKFAVMDFRIGGKNVGAAVA